MIGKMPKIPDTVEELDISNNIFTTLTNLPTALKEFSGKKNKLLTLPDLPVNARVVDLQGNPLDEWSLMDPFAQSLKEYSENTTYQFALQSLNISGANKLPPGLLRFKQLQTLRLNDVKIGGKLEELPESIEDIELDNCELEDLSGLEKCTKIKRVKASENKIKTYDGLLNSKSSITELLLNYNEIADGDLSKFENAKKIDVGDNQMNYFKSPNVNELNFVGNPLGASNTELSDDLDELKNEAEFPIDLSAVTGELVLNLDESTPTKDKVQKNTMSATQKLNVLKSLAKSPEANVKLTATDMPLPDKEWFKESPIVELKGGGDEVNSKETSAIPAKCKAVVLEKTALTAFTEVPPQLESVTLKDNKLLQVVALETESNLEEINFEENETLLDVDLGVQPNLKKVELGGQIETLSGETPELKELNVSDSNIEVIDLNNVVKLEKLVASNTKIKSLDASSFESIEVLDLSGNPEFGKDEENSLILPEKSNLTEVNISDTATKTETIGKIITALNESTNETEAPKKFQFKGAEKRPSETDDLFVNLSSARLGH